ncbi:MAG: hypothetical protein NVS3B10_30660 [Polyangiales bacterium]
MFEAARSAHVLAIGVDADQWVEAPGTVLTSITKRADVAVFGAIADAKAGKLPGGMLVLGLAEGGLDYVHEGPHAALLTAPVLARVEALRADVVSGRIVVPAE